MLPPPTLQDESARLAALHALDILDSEPEERFDRITRMARRLFDVPIALVSLVDADRQWFKSCQGLAVSETPREISFCGHTIVQDEMLIVPDALLDERFADNPLVVDEPHIRFYAGCPVAQRDGYKMGTLCLIDHRPRELSPEDLTMFADLAAMVEQELASMEMATTDVLTSLLNVRGFDVLASHMLMMSEREKRQATLLYIDLDGFKQINDACGHAEGDRVLVEFASILRHAFRESDVVARLGGDEFGVLIMGDSQGGVDRPLEVLARRVRARNAVADSRARLSYSVGKTDHAVGSHRTLAELKHAADGHMYAEKRRKRGEASHDDESGGPGGSAR